jgi:hypothetical protein
MNDEKILFPEDMFSVSLGFGATCVVALASFGLRSCLELGQKSSARSENPF